MPDHNHPPEIDDAALDADEDGFFNQTEFHAGSRPDSAESSPLRMSYELKPGLNIVSLPPVTRTPPLKGMSMR